MASLLRWLQQPPVSQATYRVVRVDESSGRVFVEVWPCSIEPPTQVVALQFINPERALAWKWSVDTDNCALLVKQVSEFMASGETVYLKVESLLVLDDRDGRVVSSRNTFILTLFSSAPDHATIGVRWAQIQVLRPTSREAEETGEAAVPAAQKPDEVPIRAAQETCESKEPDDAPVPAAKVPADLTLRRRFARREDVCA